MGDDLSHSLSAVMLDAAMNPAVGAHGGRPFHLTETSIETVGVMLKAQHIPTKLRLGYLHACLFSSSTPPGEAPMGRSLIEWDEVVRDEDGNPHELPTTAAAAHGCKATSLPPTTASVVAKFIKIMDAFVAARGALDWSLPPTASEEGLTFGQTPNTSLVGEMLAEFEHSWKIIIMRIPGGAGPHGVPGPPPDWWTRGVRAVAQQANRSWLEALKGSGARGARPLAPDLDNCDDVFNATGWLLQFYRLPELQSQLAQMPLGAEAEVFYGDDGLLHVLPRGVPSWGPPPAPAASAVPDGARSSASASAASAAPADDAVSDANGFAVGQHIEICGLASRADLNGQVGEILAPGASSGRYPVQLFNGSASVRIKPANLARTGRSPQEGKIVDGRVMLFGEWFPMPEFINVAMKSDKATTDAFAALDKRGQADVLAGRSALAAL